MAIQRQQWWLLWLLPTVVLAAEQVALVSGVTEIILIFFGVQLVSVVGHGAASLTDWAQWGDRSGSSVDMYARRLKLVQGLLLSGLAGNAFFYGSQQMADLSEIPALLGAGVAAYGGDRFLTPILTRITGK